MASKCDRERHGSSSSTSSEETGQSRGAGSESDDDRSRSRSPCARSNYPALDSGPSVFALYAQYKESVKKTQALRNQWRGQAQSGGDVLQIETELQKAVWLEKKNYITVKDAIPKFYQLSIPLTPDNRLPPLLRTVTGVDFNNAQSWNMRSDTNPIGYYLDQHIQPPADFVERYKKSIKNIHLALGAGRQEIINVYLDSIIRSYFDGRLMRYPAQPFSADEVVKVGQSVVLRRLSGKADCLIGVPVTNKFLKAKPEVFLAVSEANVDVNEAARLQCCVQVASIHLSRRRTGKKSTKAWGILSNGETWEFFFVDDDSTLYKTAEFLFNVSLKEYKAEKVAPVYQFVHFLMKNAHEASSPAGSPN